MRRRGVRTAWFTLVVLTAAALEPTLVAQRTRPDSAAVPAAGSVRGRVTGPNGVPLRGAEVRVRDPNGRENRLATTDENGAYEVVNLVPGTWNVSAAKGGYVTQYFQQRSPFAAPQTVTVNARQRAEVNFTLRRGGAIAGRLFDEFGEPVAGARVQVLRARYERGQRRLAPVAVADQTDDTGAFRLYALPPGDYYVGASLRAAGADSFIESTVGVPTYYPGTTSIADAQRLRLAPGEEVVGISFATEPVRSVTVSGVVLSASGTPAQDTSVTLFSAGDRSIIGSSLGNFGRTTANGAFAFPNVAPGSYLLRARNGAVFDPAAGQGEEALLPIIVGTEGLSGLTVTTVRTPPLEGVIVSDGAALPTSPMGVGVQELTSDASFTMTARRSSAGAVSFRVPGILGRIALNVDLPRGWMLRQAELDGVDVTDQSFELRGQAPNVRITLTDRITRISGLARADGRPSPGATVVLFADEPGKWAYPSRFVAAVKADERGAFMVEGMPPHADYLAVALDAVDAGDTQDPDFLASLREHTSRLSIDYGETKTLTLDVVAR
jgi:protocatechuate 3,4-dioxygenase beta subunit